MVFKENSISAPATDLRNTPKSFNLQKLQNDKRALRAESSTLWPSTSSRRAAGVQATRRRRSISRAVCARTPYRVRAFRFAFLFIEVDKHSGHHKTRAREPADSHQPAPRYCSRWRA